MASPRYSKAKGREFQNEAKAIVRKYAVQQGLDEEDIESAVMGESGVDIKLSPAARKVFPFSLECKRVEKLSLFAAYEQSKANHYTGTIPAVVWKRNRKDTLICMDFNDFMELYTKLTELDNES